MNPIDVYRIGRLPGWVLNLQRKVGWRRRLTVVHWRLLAIRGGFPIRKVGRSWVGPRWQAEWPNCQCAVRAWTEAGAYRKGARAYKAQHDAAA